MFRTAGPPALTSPVYARDFNEVKSVGSATSTVRTPGPDRGRDLVARPAPTEWEIKRQLAADPAADRPADRPHVRDGRPHQRRHGDRLLQRERGVELLAAGHGDPARRHRRQPRTVPDPDWTPLLVTPPFPDYPSGHACCTRREMTTYAHFFGRDASRSAPTASTPHDAALHQLLQALAEVINARVWGGIHFRTADIQGVHLGIGVSRFATARYYQPFWGNLPADRWRRVRRLVSDAPAAPTCQWSGAFDEGPCVRRRPRTSWPTRSAGHTPAGSFDPPSDWNAARDDPAAKATDGST